MSSHPLSTAEYNILQKRLNYNIDDANQLEFLAALEAAIKAWHRDPRKHEVDITPHSRRTWNQNQLIAENRTALKNLKKDQNIIIIIPKDKAEPYLLWTDHKCI